MTVKKSISDYLCPCLSEQVKLFEGNPLCGFYSLPDGVCICEGKNNSPECEPAMEYELDKFEIEHLIFNEKNLQRSTRKLSSTSFERAFSKVEDKLEKRSSYALSSAKYVLPQKDILFEVPKRGHPLLNPPKKQSIVNIFGPEYH